MDEATRIAALEAELASVRAEMQDFSYTVSHDLRASLRHILSYAQLVQEDAAALLPPETMGFVQTIGDSARHMGLLMDGLMELSRLGTVPLQLGPVPLQPLLQALVDAARQAQPARNIQWELQPDLPVVWADATLLRAAMGHVLDNAVKFSALAPQAQIRIGSAATPDPAAAVQLQVADNGAGFNAALTAQLFKPFSRLHTVKQFPGIGMGLAQTRKMLRRMGGEAQAEGASGAGCTVTLTLPRAPA